MNWLRSKLRAWLGIEAYEGSIELLRERMDEIQKLPTLAEVSRKQFEIDLAIQELKELKQAIADPRHRPVVTRTMREYKALMEQD